MRRAGSFTGRPPTRATVSKPRRAYQVPRPVLGRRLQENQVAAGRSGKVDRPGEHGVGMSPPPGLGGRQHRVHRSRGAVHPQLTGGHDPALLADHQVGDREDLVVEVLAAHQLRPPPRPAAGRARPGPGATNVPRTRAPPSASTTSARSPPDVGAGRRAITSSSSVRQPAAAQLGGDGRGAGPQQRGRLARPAGVPRPPRQPPNSTVPASTGAVQHQLVVVQGVRRSPGRAPRPRRARRRRRRRAGPGRRRRRRTARANASSGAGSTTDAGGRYGTTATTAVTGERPVEVGEAHARRVVG